LTQRHWLYAVVLEDRARNKNRKEAGRIIVQATEMLISRPIAQRV